MEEESKNYPSSDQPRMAALELLRLVRDEGAYANLALPQVLRKYKLNGRDAAFTVELAYGVLRNQSLYDSMAQKCSSRALVTVEPEIIDILRLGIHQIYAMRVPDHAAVDTCASLARVSVRGKDAGHIKARVGFVNAVLRCITKSEFDVEMLSLAERYSHQDWIVKAFEESLVHNRLAANELEALLQANNTAADPVVAVRDGELDILGTIPGRWSKQARILTEVIPLELEQVRDGSAIVQDEGSQLVAQAFLLAQPTGPESSWLDMCAGPGGKAALISDAVPDGVEFIAVDLHQHRVDLMKKIVGSSAQLLTGDARERPWGNRFFDRVLLDAPCSGLGALRRRPEARWRKTKKETLALTGLQEELLLAAIDSTRIGGIIAYVTCSPYIEETWTVVDSVLQSRTDIQPEDARGLFPGVSDLGNGPYVQLWPHVHGTDAMFFALLRRV
jgi:16S rRNA (cytosine967-C5)-methyltransferase